ncbi:MAG: hypothetical protein A4S16_09035 [Proteobacteria bacterium SG_bin6]|nr:MAG: hypothetical protein A4S16_09035 [Proteobacteria bacterium SG_bin6]
MRQLTFVRPGAIEWREVPDAVVRSGIEAVVRPIVLGRCDLDVGFVRGLAPMREGEPIGHEMIGEVVEVGDLVHSVSVRQIVIVPSQIIRARNKIGRSAERSALSRSTRGADERSRAPPGAEAL